MYKGTWKRVEQEAIAAWAFDRRRAAINCFSVKVEKYLGWKRELKYSYWIRSRRSKLGDFDLGCWMYKIEEI